MINKGKTLVSLNGKRLEKKADFSLKRKQPGKRLDPNSQKSLLDILKSKYSKRIMSGVLAVSVFSGATLIISSRSVASASKEKMPNEAQIINSAFIEPSKRVSMLLDTKPILDSIKYRQQESSHLAPYNFSFYNNFKDLAITTPLLIESPKISMMVNATPKEGPIRTNNLEQSTTLETKSSAALPLEKDAPITEEQSLETMRKEILEHYNLTDEQFDIICAIVLAEAWANSYEDAYAVINTIFNRTRSYKWHYSVDAIYGEGAGYSLYYQVILKGQFSVYSSGKYKEFLGVRDLPGYKAVLDFLTTQEPMHDYLNFYANFGDKEGKEQFVKHGNLYYNHLKEKDIIPTEEVLTL